MSGKSVVDQIRHYQKDIERCPDNAERMIRCIQRLYVLPILVQHLQETGVGRSVNSLRKYNGEVGDAAKALVAKWKAMVAAEESSDGDHLRETDEDPPTPDHKSRENGHLTEKRKTDEPKKKKRCVRETRRKRVESESESSRSDKTRESSNDSGSSDESEPKRKSRSSHSHHRSSESKSPSSHGGSSKSKSSNHKSKAVKVKLERNDDGSIDGGSGFSFADALLGVDSSVSSKKKKKLTIKEEKPSVKPSPSSSHSSPHKSSHSSKSKNSNSHHSTMPNLLAVKLEPKPSLDILDLDLKSTLPEISPMYKPLPHVPENIRKNHKAMSEEDHMFSIMMSKNQRTKVYSGAKTGVYLTVPSLFGLCIQVLYENVDDIEYTGGIPYDLLKPLLIKLNADQLFNLENYNAYLIGDTDELWAFHCRKDFRNEKREDMESWRDLYMRCMDERAKKLEALRANINESIAKSTPVRKAKLAYVDSVVKPPRNVAKYQAKYGTGGKVNPMAALKSNAAQKTEILNKAVVGAHTPGLVVSGSVPTPARASSAAPVASSSSSMKKKKAPLMAKALQLIKGNRFKR